jgi:AbiV family abortive infection protein
MHVERQFAETAKACLANGDRLLFDAEMLASSPTSLVLAILAEEEFAKGFLLWLVDQGIVPWTNAIWRATRDHSCKHLLSMLLEYADPDIDEIMASMKRAEARHEVVMNLFDQMRSLGQPNATRDLAEMNALIEHRNELWREVNRLNEEEQLERAFPPRIADAMNILRHAKIGNWERGYAYDDEKYDHAAQAIADGAKDREKQRAFYVGVTKSGAASSCPDDISEQDVVKAVERSKRLRLVLCGLLERGGAGIEFERLVESLRVMFASPEELRKLIPEKKDYVVLVHRKCSRAKTSYVACAASESRELACDQV